MGKGRLFVVLDFLVNLGGPWLVYRLVEGSTSITGALVLSSVPPIIWSLWQLVHSRKLDAISLLVIAGIAEDQFAAKWSVPSFRQTFYLMTAVWGAGLIAQTMLQIILAFALSIEQDLVVSPIAGYGFYFALFGWSFWYGKKQKKQGERLAAAR